MFWDKSFFVTYAPSTNQRISVGDARDIPVDGLGSIQLRVKLPNGYRTVTLHGVMHAPRLAMNLISLSALQKEGVEYYSAPFGP